MTDLWHEASADHDLEAREASLARADAEMLPVYSFLLQSRTSRELEHRLAFAATRIERVSDATGVPAGELEEAARRRYALLKEALPEGVDPLDPILQAGQGFGSGPAQGYQHAEGPDFSGGYSEIPQGAPGGPDPSVTQVAEPGPEKVSETTASLCRCGSLLTKKGKCQTCRSKTANCMCRTADTTSGSPPSGPPMSATPPAGGAPAGMPAGAGGGAGGAGPMGAPPILPAGVGGGASAAPDGAAPGGMNSSTSQAPMSAAPAGVQDSSTSGGQNVTASRDPVALQVTAIAHSVAASNPMLTESECRRVARRVVGGYLRMTADSASGVMSDEPWAGSPGGGDNTGGTGGGSSGGMGVGEYGLGRQLINKIPGGGAGAGAAGAGEAAGAAGAGAELAELAPLVAL